MIQRTYDMNVTASELNTANVWWRSLSINQMKEFESRHFPSWQQLPHKRMIHQMWEEEDKPEPQTLIPV